MQKIVTNIEELIGNTPLFEIRNIAKKDDLKARVLVKIEAFNLTGSIKDRVALNMLKVAKNEGLINEDTLIIEPTSGNTGIGLAAVSSALGYRCLIVMPDSMSVERQRLMKAYGAELVLTKGSLGMQGALDKATQLAKENPNSFIPSQFENKANPQIHYLTTGKEIYEAVDGDIDIFVASIGTGGTISGVSKYLKEKNAKIKTIGLEPETSPLITKGQAGPHGIQGIGANFIPDTLNLDYVDEVVTISLEESYEASRRMGKEEGVLCGISSGANLAMALKLARLEENRGKTIVTVLPDSGDRYLSNPLFAEDI